MWRKRMASALFGLGLLVMVAVGQPPAPPKDKAVTKALGQPLLKEKVTEKKADTVEALIEAALVTDPDIRMARAKLQLAEGELAKARQQVALKVTALHSSIAEQRRAVMLAEVKAALAEQARAKGSVSQEESLAAIGKLESARGALAQSEAELKLITGGTKAGGWAVQAPADALHAGAAACAVCHMLPLTRAKDDDVRKGVAWLYSVDQIHGRVGQGMPLPSAPAKLPTDAIQERIRVALDKKVKLGPKGEQVSLAKATEVFQKQGGLDVSVRVAPVFGSAQGIATATPGDLLNIVILKSEGEELPIGAWFQLFQDFNGGAFYVREYGLLLTTKEAAPSDALTLTQFWQARPSLTGSAAKGGTGKTHEFERAKLPATVKIKAGDTVVVVEPVASSNVEDVKVQTDDAAVTIKGVTTDANLKIVIRGEKAGKAKVTWKYNTADGKTFGHDGLVVEVE